MSTRILSKLAAAKWLHVSQSTLSNYLRDGRIKAHSLVGSGRHAKLDLARAVADLKKNLDEERLLLPHRRVYLSTEVPPWWDEFESSPDITGGSTVKQKSRTHGR